MSGKIQFLSLYKFLSLSSSAILILVLLMPVAFAQAQSGGDAKVIVRGWEHSGFGRLVFDWSIAVDYNVRLEGQTLYINFDQTASTDLGQAVTNLNNYVSKGNVADDGRTISFDLIAPVTLSHFRNDDAIVVDLRKEAKQEQKLSSDGPELRVRVGTHPGYIRMVFDWTRPVEYSVTQQGDKISIWFNQKAGINTIKLASDLPAGYEKPESGPANNGTEMTLNAPKDVQIRHFLSGDKVVVDFLTKTGKQEIPKADVTASPPALDSLSVSVVETSPVDLNPAGKSNPVEYPSPTSQPINKETTTKIVSVDDAELATAAPVEPAVTANRNLGPPPVSLAFQWPEEVGAAAFRRGKNVWIVFDRRTKIDLAPLRALGQPLIERMEQLPIGGATVLRLKTKNGINPTAKREGFDWVFDFRKQDMMPAYQIAIQAEADADLGPQLVFPSDDPGNVVHLFDPEIGDTLRVAAYKEAGYGVKGTRAYPEFQILPSAQGLVIETLADDLIFDRDFNGFQLSSPEGLHISGVSPEALVSTGPQLSAKRMFDFEKWYQPELPNFYEAKRKLSQAVLEVPPEKKNAARIDLARFFVARGMGPDAAAIVHLIEENEPGIAGDPQFRALRGAARYLNKDYEEAKQDFFDPKLDGFAESAIWRGAASAKTGDWKMAASQFRPGDSILRKYTYPLKGDLGIVRTEAALATRDLRTADSWLKELDSDREQLRRSQWGDVRYQQARIAMTRNDVEKATNLWEELRMSDDTRNAVRADYSLINLGLKQGTMTHDEAIERLDKMRYRWRGDRFELSVLKRLSEIYIEKNDYLNGLEMMRIAVSYFSDEPEAEKIAKKMTDIFRELYLEDGADRLPPLRAVAVYDEFRELTPSGPDGDLMVEKLADRLIDVDLLNRADALLLHQVNFRLKGEEKARVGAKLALVRLINDDPNSAIEALDSTNFLQIDVDLENDRRRIRAKSYFELGEIQTAVKLLAGDVTIEADMLRRDIFWHEKNWTDVAKVLQRLAGDPPSDPETGFTDERARYILNWAVALLLSEDTEGFKALRNIFGPGMAYSSAAETFEYITRPVAGGVGPSLDATIQQLTSKEDFNSFMDNYRQKFLSSGEDDNIETMNVEATSNVDVGNAEEGSALPG